mmetsp:Transcript_130155/g.239450  ORF Transcript_130155/g.239450 Transcript_130155/m.239450 type:complete len:1615 (-) Transcript_130155:72-4916(-)
MMRAVVALAAVGGGAAYERWNIISQRTCQGVQTSYGQCVGLPPCVSCVPQNCEFGDWSQWQEDTSTCSGLCTRQRSIAIQSNECGSACQGNTEETKECIRPECKAAVQDCVFGEWSHYHMAECKHDEDQMYRYRTVGQPPRGDGKMCIGSTKETSPCTPDLEQHDCVFDSWSLWTDCSSVGKGCGLGRKTRQRRILEEGTHGGATCEGDIYEVSNCTLQACTEESYDCKFGNWGAWIGCDGASPYQQYRKRRVVVPTSGTGKPCTGTTKEIKSCDADLATTPTYCKMSAWTEWGACDKTCIGGQSYRSRVLRTPQSFNVSCISGPIREMRPCGTSIDCHPPTPGDCVLSNWADWTICSNRCGAGIKTRQRQITPATTGQGCTALLEEVGNCTRYECTNTDCRWADWGQWGACSATCDGGIKRRNRHIAVSPELNGTLCAPNAKQEVAACSTNKCPEECIDGEWSPWSSWSRCSATCDDGYMSRHRNVHTAANNCGKPAEGLEQEFKECPNLPDCVPRKDCDIAQWGQWSDCTCSCFGIKERTRSVVQYKQGKGLSCFNESLKQIEACNPVVGGTAPAGCDSKIPKRDCKLHDWSAWSPCTVTCGRGQMYRVRHILVPPSHGGAPCGEALQQTKQCSMIGCTTDTHECLDCVWGQWNDWGSCLKGDQRWRHRHIETKPNYCGKLCGYAASKEIGNCTSDAPSGTLFCAWTDWSGFSECPFENFGACGTATRGRHRHLEITTSKPAKGWLISGGHGLTCTGEQAEVAVCPVKQSCVKACVPRDCEFQIWSQWTQPTSEGLCSRFRQIKVMNNDCGKPCEGVLVDTQACVPQTVAVLDCRISDWTQWSTCNHRNQQKYRIRTIRQMPQGGGEDCNGALRETAGCAANTASPIDCSVTTWSEWNDCSATCGWGYHIRTRRIDLPAMNGGSPCNDALEELQGCTVQACTGVVPKDCALSVWEDWARCDHTGQRTRSKVVVQEAENGGTPCSSGDMEEIAGCDLFQKLDCQLSDWVEWGSCSRTCTGGQQTRHRQVHQYPLFGGAACPPVMEMTQARPCNEYTSCGPSHPCQVSSWAEWSPCSVSCGAGEHTRWRNVTQTRAGSGAGCNESLIEAASCHLPACEVENCQWGEWDDWASCSKNCGGGQQQRERVIVTYPKHGGLACTPGDKIQTKGCNDHKCQTNICQDAVWALWGEWGVCSMTCRGGVTMRSRGIQIPANSCGKTAEGLSQEVSSCNSDVPCDQDKNCVFTQWGPWDDCSATCNGFKKRTRTILSKGSGDGLFCNGDLSEIVSCSPAVGETYPVGCPKAGEAQDCSFAPWSKWHDCSATCGQGQTYRVRVINSTAQNGGKGCNAPIKVTKPCKLDDCNFSVPGTFKPNPIDPCAPGGGGVYTPPTTGKISDCQWQDWEHWSACDKCPGQKYRHRSIAQLPVGGGKPCKMEASKETKECPRNCYQMYMCTWAIWGHWSDCMAKCGEGQRSRQRQLVVASVDVPERLWEAGLHSAEHFDETLQQLKDSQSRQWQEMAIAFGAGLAAFAAVFAVAVRLNDQKQVRRSQEGEANTPRTATVERYAPLSTQESPESARERECDIPEEPNALDMPLIGHGDDSDVELQTYSTQVGI